MMKAVRGEASSSTRRWSLFVRRLSLLAVVAVGLTLLSATVGTRPFPLSKGIGDSSQVGMQRGDVWRGLRNHAIEAEGAIKNCKMHGRGNKRILVTGAAGFIGYHTTLAIQKRGDAVIGLDSFTDYYPVIMKRERAKLLGRCIRIRTRLKEFLGDVGIDIIEGDLLDEDLIRSILEDCGVTHVVHLAAQAGVRYAKTHPMKYVENNVRGTVSLFDAACHITTPPAIVYASSSSVYGSNSHVPFSESDAVDHPTSLYGVTKRSIELTAVVYHRLFDLSLTGLRFFTVYGPMGRPDMASFQFAKAIVKRKPIKIFTSPDGQELGRDFTYVDDIVRGILAAVDQIPPSGPNRAHNEIYNLGNTHPVTVTEFVRALERAMDQESPKEYVTVKNNGDVLFTHANVSKAKAAFNFSPSIGLNEGLNRFASWFRNYSSEMSDELWMYEQV